MTTDGLRIETPEQVALELQIAGIGSRFLAITVDTLVQAGVYLLLAIAFGLGATTILAALVPRSRQWLSLEAALLVLFIFGLYWGYFSLFEIIWKGQTPGKRVAGIRVIMESGAPVSASAAILRNLLRAVDFLPALYGVGVLCMILNRHSRRLGDFVAGTIVVHDQRIDVVPDWGASDAPDVSSSEAARVTEEEVVLIEAYLERRLTLGPAVQDRMATQIARRIIERTGLRPAAGQSVDDFLMAVARGARDAARFR